MRYSADPRFLTTNINRLGNMQCVLGGQINDVRYASLLVKNTGLTEFFGRKIWPVTNDDETIDDL